MFYKKPPNKTDFSNLHQHKAQCFSYYHKKRATSEKKKKKSFGSLIYEEKSPIDNVKHFQHPT